MAPLVVESWTWYGFATTVLAARMLSRVLKRGQITRPNASTTYNIWRGIKKLQVADALMALAFCFYTADIITMNITAQLQSNLLPPNYLEYHVMPPSEIAARRFGSIMTVVVEQCQISTIWLIKFCVLLMWAEITNMAFKWRHRLVVAIGCYVAFTWLFMEVFYFGVWCRPFYNYWAVPTPDPKQCAAAWNHLITNAVFNLTSDLMLLAITVSIAFEQSLSTFTASSTRSLAFVGLCSLGIFVIICAILNKAYSWENPYGSEWTFWYIREVSTAMILSNVPYAWKLGKIGLHMRESGPGRSKAGTGSLSVIDSSRRRPSDGPWDDIDFNADHAMKQLETPALAHKKSLCVDEYSVPSSTTSSPTAPDPRHYMARADSRQGILEHSAYRITSVQEAEALGEEKNWHITHATRRKMPSISSESGETAEIVDLAPHDLESALSGPRRGPVARPSAYHAQAREKDEVLISPVETSSQSLVSSQPPQRAPDPWEAGLDIEDVGGLSRR